MMNYEIASGLKSLAMTVELISKPLDNLDLDFKGD